MSEGDKKLCVILGGGGHGCVLLDILRGSGIAVVHAILDVDRSKWGRDLFGVPILGDDGSLSEVARQGVDYFLVGIGSTGDSLPRQRLFELGLSHNLKPLTVIHTTAWCSDLAQVGPGSQLFPGSIVNARATLGVNVIVNTGAIVEHDCILGDHVHVATGAQLASTVKVGAGAHIGAGATVKELISIGEGAVIGAGAAVVENVSARTVVVGWISKAQTLLRGFISKVCAFWANLSTSLATITRMEQTNSSIWMLWQAFTDAIAWWISLEVPQKRFSFP
jgi:UDP-perosamine 4-acetyltransferase